METLHTPQGTLAALGATKLECIYREPAAASPLPPDLAQCLPSQMQQVARHIGRELLAIRHDRARLTEALLHLAEL